MFIPELGKPVWEEVLVCISFRADVLYLELSHTLSFHS